MEAPQIHLALNHFPLISVLIGTGILVAGMIKKSKLLQNTAAILFTAAAIITIPVYQSGEETEEVVEEQGGISHDVIHDHEEAAETATYILYALGLLSLGFLFVPALQKNYFLILMLLVALTAFAFTGYTAKQGGEIRHEYLRDL